MIEPREIQDGRSFRNHLDQAPILQQTQTEIQRENKLIKIR